MQDIVYKLVPGLFKSEFREGETLGDRYMHFKYIIRSRANKAGTVLY